MPDHPSFHPQQPELDSHIGARGYFAGIVGRNTSDYLMQSAHRHHIQLSQMADAKANMIITVSSIVLTLSFARLNDPSLRTSVIVLVSFTMAALLMAIIAVLPKYRPLHISDPQQLPSFFNVMFFGHFSAIPKDRFYEVLGQTLRYDASVYETLANDLYSIGTYLARHKYRYLRLSYLFFLIGFLLAGLDQIRMHI
jgi:hypothetical protein